MNEKSPIRPIEATIAPSPESPFHGGEQAAQAHLGVRDIEPWARRVVRPYLPQEHRAFHTAQPFLVAAARDEAEQPWATLLVGDEGFVTSPDPYTLEIDARPHHGVRFGEPGRQPLAFDLGGLQRPSGHLGRGGVIFPRLFHPGQRGPVGTGARAR